MPRKTKKGDALTELLSAASHKVLSQLIVKLVTEFPDVRRECFDFLKSQVSVSKALVQRSEGEAVLALWSELAPDLEELDDYGGGDYATEDHVADLLYQIQERLESGEVDAGSRQEILDAVLPFIESSNAGLDDMLYDVAYATCYDDMRSALPEASPGAFKVLISRAEKSGLLKRVCRGIYLYPRVSYPSGLVLYHTAAKLRADSFNYLSLETVLSDAGVISQISTNWITLMSSGRSHIVNCADFGHVEYIHTKRRPDDVADQLSYDQDCHLWRASVALALQDMRLTRRSTDLVDWEVAGEYL